MVMTANWLSFFLGVTLSIMWTISRECLYSRKTLSPWSRGFWSGLYCAFAVMALRLAVQLIAVTWRDT